MISMAQADLDALRQRLEDERRRLQALIAETNDENVNAQEQYDSSEFSGYGNHEAESATEIYEQERNLAIEGDLAAQLSQVEHALARFDAGTYGICEICGKEIARERLQAFPAATLCIDDQRKVEAQQH